MSGLECHIDRVGQYTIQIFGNDGSQPKEPTGSFPPIDESKQR